MTRRTRTRALTALAVLAPVVLAVLTTTRVSTQTGAPPVSAQRIARNVSSTCASLMAQT